MLALAFGLVPEERRRGLQEKLVDDVLVTRAGHQMVGIAGNRWIHPGALAGRARGCAGRGEGRVHDRAADDVPELRLLGVSLGWTSLGEFWE